MGQYKTNIQRDKMSRQESKHPPRHGHVAVPLMEDNYARGNQTNSFMTSNTAEMPPRQRFAGREMKDNGGKTEHGYSFVQLIFGVIMLVIGLKYQPSSGEGYITDDKTDPSSKVIEERDPCPNGAANYLYIAGICILAANLVNIVAKASHFLAERDGKISCCEKCGLCIMGAASGVMAAVDFAMLIWGSVVVFGAWSSWTPDYAVYAAAPDDYNYCAYEPMMWAFGILITKWVMIPLVFLVVCCCGTLCACCFFKASD